MKRGTTTFSIMTLVIKGLFVTLSINDTHHNNALHYAECRILYIVMLIVVAPEKGPFEHKVPLGFTLFTFVHAKSPEFVIQCCVVIVKYFFEK